MPSPWVKFREFVTLTNQWGRWELLKSPTRYCISGFYRGFDWIFDQWLISEVGESASSRHQGTGSWISRENFDVRKFRKCTLGTSYHIPELPENCVSSRWRSTHPECSCVSYSCASCGISLTTWEQTVQLREWNIDILLDIHRSSKMQANLLIQFFWVKNFKNLNINYCLAWLTFRENVLLSHL